jgi:hypothetical protein
MMPTMFTYYYGKDESPRIRAWAAHYERKGCHPVKAERVASEKVRRSHTWPPR